MDHVLSVSQQSSQLIASDSVSAAIIVHAFRLLTRPIANYARAPVAYEIHSQLAMNIMSNQNAGAHVVAICESKAMNFSKLDTCSAKRF